MHDVAASVEDLLAGAERREPFVNPDGRSSAAFERVWIDGAPHVVKYAHVDDDFLMRVSGDIGCRPVRAWADGHCDAAPDLVDHAVVGCARGHGRNGWGAAILMRDVTDDLFPDDGGVLDPETHAAFVDHIAGFCAGGWGWSDDPDAPVLLPYDTRYAWFGEAALRGEEALGWPERTPQVARDGWLRLTGRMPAEVEDVLTALRHDHTPLTSALRSTPSCLVHGDVKASNTGVAADGRTVLIDWAYVGEGPACHELCWHLALDRDRLPRSKEATIESFRAALERHGVTTAPWWDRQLALCLLGALVQFGWEKAYGDDDELRWWVEAARPGIALL